MKAACARVARPWCMLGGDLGRCCGYARPSSGGPESAGVDAAPSRG